MKYQAPVVHKLSHTDQTTLCPKTNVKIDGLENIHNFILKKFIYHEVVILSPHNTILD